MSRGDAISDSPIFDWPLDSLSSGKFIDMVGNSFGSIGGDVALFNDPIRGMVAEFDGEDDFISFGDLDELDTPSSFTVSLWFYKHMIIVVNLQIMASTMFSLHSPVLYQTIISKLELKEHD